MRRVIVILGSLLWFIAFTYNSAFADNYYVGHWVWNSTDTRWEPPQFNSIIGSLDLRSNSQCAVPGPNPQGWGLFAYSTPQTDSNLVLDLGTNLNTTISVSTLTWLRNNISSAPIAALTIKSAIWAIMNSLADPTGITKVKNLMPDNQGNLNLYIAGNIILSKRIEPFKSPEWANVQKQYQLDYATIRHDVQYAMLPPNFHREQLAYWSQLYGIDYHAFIPAGLPDESPIDYGTTQSENFNCANNASSMNCQQTWVVVGDVNAQLGIKTSSGADEVGSSVFNYGRAEADVTGANHFVQLDITQLTESGVSFRGVGMMARFDSGPGAGTSLETGYNCGGSGQSDGSEKFYCNKVLGGTSSSIGSLIAWTPGTYPGTEKVQVNGSQITTFWRGSQMDNFTDTAISTGTRGGVFSRASNPESNAWDNWSITDLAAGTTPQPHKQNMMIINY